MKRVTLLIALISLALAWAAHRAGATEQASRRVIGGFEMAGFLNVGAGWQHFSNDLVTGLANDGSYAGVLGSVLPAVATGVAPDPGEDTAQAFVEVIEIDIIKSLGERAKLRGDIYIGRPLSGSWVPNPGVEVEQAYLTAVISKKMGIEFTIGRFITLAGFEYTEPYLNDTISWSILARSNMYPYFATGAQISAEISDNVVLYVAAANGLTNDSTIKINDVPAGFATLDVSWGDEDKESWFVFTPFIGPESDSNRHLTYGANAAFAAWLADPFQLGLEAVFRRDNSAGGADTEYAGGLVNLRWDITDKLYGVARYAFARQFDDGSGVFNLTGAKQNIHEASLGGGYMIADGVKFKLEGRVDAVDPDAGDTQWVPGVAIALACAF